MVLKGRRYGTRVRAIGDDMEANKIVLNALFHTDRRYVVPLFQRPYVREEEAQWQPLWEDICGVAQRRLDGRSNGSHFLGAIVLEQLKTPSTVVEARQVIDGQQRLTTLQVLLAALRDRARTTGATLDQRVLEKLTRNNHEYIAPPPSPPAP